jgi:restriction system protein
MAVPTWDEMIRPILEELNVGDVTRMEAYSRVCDFFDLNDSQRQERLPSGGLRVANRAGWALTHLSKGGLVSKVKRGTYRITERGREFLKTHPGSITYQTLKDDVPEYQQAWQEAMEQKAEQRADDTGEPEVAEGESTSTPEETIDRALNTITTSLRSELMAQLREIDPTVSSKWCWMFCSRWVTGARVRRPRKSPENRTTRGSTGSSTRTAWGWT